MYILERKIERVYMENFTWEWFKDQKQSKAIICHAYNETVILFKMLDALNLGWGWNLPDRSTDEIIDPYSKYNPWTIDSDCLYVDNKGDAVHTLKSALERYEIIIDFKDIPIELKNEFYDKPILNSNNFFQRFVAESFNIGITCTNKKQFLQFLVLIVEKHPEIILDEFLNTHFNEIIQEAYSEVNRVAAYKKYYFYCVHNTDDQNICYVGYIYDEDINGLQLWEKLNHLYDFYEVFPYITERVNEMKKEHDVPFSWEDFFNDSNYYYVYCKTRQEISQFFDFLIQAGIATYVELEEMIKDREVFLNQVLDGSKNGILVDNRGAWYSYRDIDARDKYVYTFEEVLENSKGEQMDFNQVDEVIKNGEIEMDNTEEVKEKEVTETKATGTEITINTVVDKELPIKNTAYSSKCWKMKVTAISAISTAPIGSVILNKIYEVKDGIIILENGIKAKKSYFSYYNFHTEDTDYGDKAGISWQYIYNYTDTKKEKKKEKVVDTGIPCNKFLERCFRPKQDKLKEQLIKDLKEVGYAPIVGDGYIYAVGDFPVLLTAHMDTVHKSAPYVIAMGYLERDKKKLTGVMSPQGIGGDDRCGIYMILQLVKTYKCSILFCEDEEIGCVGVKKFIKSMPGVVNNLKIQCNYIIELDRKGSDDAVFYNCDNKDFETFITTKTKFKKAFGSCSDISHLAPAVGLAAVNFSCAYYNPHTDDEYVLLEELEENIEEIKKLLTISETCGAYDYIEKTYNYAGGKGYTNNYHNYNADDAYDAEEDYAKSYFKPVKATKKDKKSSVINKSKPKSIPADTLDITMEVIFFRSGIETTTEVSGFTKAELWFNFFMDNPDICYNDVSDYSIF